MILDSQEIFSAAQAVTSTGDTASTNVLDTLAAQDEGVGHSVYLVCQVNTTATSGGSATVQAVLQTSADNSSWSDVAAGAAVAVASVTAKTQLFRTKLPLGLQRYVRVVWRVGTAALTAGKFDAFLTMDIQQSTPYASGFSVS